QDERPLGMTEVSTSEDEHGRANPQGIDQAPCSLEPARLHQIIESGGMQIDQRLVGAKDSRSQISQSGRDIADKNYLVIKGFGRGSTTLFEQSIQVTQTHILKRRWT